MKTIKTEIMKKAVLFLTVLALTFANCTTVDSGKQGVKVSMNNGTDMTKVYDEGTYYGLSWLWNDMVEYDVRETTTVETFKFNDINDMPVTVVISLDYSMQKGHVNKIHKLIDNFNVKVQNSLSSAAKEVVPQYSAVDLNKNKRQEAEDKLKVILKQELPEFYAEFKRVRFMDVDLPKEISRLAVLTAEQLGKNELATKKEAEEQALAKALIAKEKGIYEATLFQDKTKALLSKPQFLKLKELEIEMEYAKQGKSKYGNNNVFGGSTAVVKGLRN